MDLNTTHLENQLQNQLQNQLLNCNLSSNFNLNIKIGSRIKLFNIDTEYIFYGYNCDQSYISCFPVNSSNKHNYIADNLIYIPINQIEQLLF